LNRSEKGLRQTLSFRKGAKPDKSPPRSSHHIRNRNARDLRAVRSGLREKTLAQRSTTFKRASQSGEPGNISSMRAGGWRTYFGGVRDCQRRCRAPERDRTQNSERGATGVRKTAGAEDRLPGMGWRDTRCFHHVSEARASNCHGAGESFRRQAHLRMER